MTPALSVVVPFVNGSDDLAGVLSALDAQRDDVLLEALVVSRQPSDLSRGPVEPHPWARVIQVGPDSTIPEMRAIAFRSATADSVAVIEDHVRVPPGWARALLAAQSSESPVVGGGVENSATERLVDWAAFLCEYSHCLPPIPAGRVDWLTGNNVVYPRSLLDQYRGVVESGAWENRLHDAFRRDGIPLTCHPEIVVGHKMHYTIGLYVSQRYLYSRSYAGARSGDLGLVKRCMHGIACALLPPVLMARIVARVFPKKTYRAQLAKSLPLLMLFVVAWAAGEFVGYVFGAGRSLSQVR